MELFKDRRNGLVIEAFSDLLNETPEPERKPHYSGASGFAYHPEMGASFLVHSLYEEHDRFHLWKYGWSGDTEGNLTRFVGGPNLYYTYKIEGVSVTPIEFQKAVYKAYGKNWPAFKIIGGIYLPAISLGKDYKTIYKKADSLKRKARRESVIGQREIALKKAEEEARKLCLQLSRISSKKKKAKLRAKLNTIRNRIRNLAPAVAA